MKVSFWDVSLIIYALEENRFFKPPNVVSPLKFLRNSELNFKSFVLLSSSFSMCVSLIKKQATILNMRLFGLFAWQKSKQWDFRWGCGPKRFEYGVFSKHDTNTIPGFLLSDRSKNWLLVSAWVSGASSSNLIPLRTYRNAFCMNVAPAVNLT